MKAITKTKVEGVSRAKVMEAAKEFGEALANCDECKAVRDAHEALNKDKDAKKLISEYQSIQRSIQALRMWGREVTKDKLDKLKKIEVKMNFNPAIKNLSDAQKRLQEMLLNLNDEISSLLGIDFAANSGSGCC